MMPSYTHVFEASPHFLVWALAKAGIMNLNISGSLHPLRINPSLYPIQALPKWPLPSFPPTIPLEKITPLPIHCSHLPKPPHLCPCLGLSQTHLPFVHLVEISPLPNSSDSEGMSTFPDRAADGDLSEDKGSSSLPLAPQHPAQAWPWGDAPCVCWACQWNWSNQLRPFLAEQP